MLSEAEALARCADLIASARGLGADAADAVYVGNHSQSAQVRLGKLEDVDRSEAEHFGLRVFVGGRHATIGCTSLREGSADELATRALAMARAAPVDEFAGLAPDERLMRGGAPDLDLVSPEMPVALLRERALACEDAARANPKVANSEGATAGTGGSTFALVTSHGVARSCSQSHHSLSAAVVAGHGSAMERGSEWRVARHAGDLPDPGTIGAKAAERAVARLDPGSLRSGAMPVVFDPEAGRSLIGHLVAAMSGPAIVRGASFLIDCEGSQLFARDITIVDDPLRPRGLASRAFDGEGLATAPTCLVERGVLGDWLLDAASARKLGREPTGHAVRSGGGGPGVAPSNVVLQPGPESVAQLIADIGEGVLVTDLIGHGVNPVTGDYSRGASGFAIRGGEIAGPVAGITVAGNLRDMFAAMRAADDLTMLYPVNVPTLRIDGMTVAGS